MNDKIAILLPHFGMGGIARMMVNLANGMTDAGLQTHFILNSSIHLPFIRDLAPNVRIIELKKRKPPQMAAALSDYLKKVHPAVLLSSRMKHGHQLAIAGRRQANVSTRIFLRIPTHMTRRGKNQNLIKRCREKQQLRQVIREADGIIAVSRGVAQDISKISGMPEAAIYVAPNPVISDKIYHMSQKPLDHQWLAKKGPPVILSAGGFRNQKDFLTLIKAFARLRKTYNARLIIIGEGRLEKKMLKLARRLNIEKDVDLPGFADNPYPLMANAAVYVLSSAWEGSPNVLVEAMALGTPVVSTDCPSGPREILKDGAYGRLVPVGDDIEMSRAILETLAAPLPRQQLHAAAQRFTIRNSVQAYLNAFGGVQAGRYPYAALNGSSNDIENNLTPL